MKRSMGSPHSMPIKLVYLNDSAAVATWGRGEVRETIHPPASERLLI